VFVPDTAVGDEDALIEEFFRFVHYCIVDERCCDFGIVKGPEVNAYCALYYEAQVNNGGHGQFIGNADNDLRLFEAALSGLMQVGARPQAVILQHMIAWTQANHERVEGTSTTDLLREEALKPLDDQFFNENEASSIKSLIKIWLEGLPDLRVIPERDFLYLLENPGSMRSN
jgi:hypothetical protein